MNIPTLTHQQWGEVFTLIPSFGRYENGRLAFQLYMEDGEPFATVTVNMPAADLGENEHTVFVKNYAENEEVVKTLVKEGWLTPLPVTTKSGYVSVPMMRLDGVLLEWFQSLDASEVL